jgi:all-trans-retinol 13,14-reductase
MATPFHCVVIGSGVGGLAAALHVARAGRSVLLLEAARDFGGMLNPFRRGRYEFDVGLHYVGLGGEGQGFRRVLDKLGLERVRFREIDPDCIDRYVFDGYEGRLVKGADRFVQRLVDDFPAERDALRRFEAVLDSADALRKLSMGGGGWKAVLSAARHPIELTRLVNEPFGRFLDRNFRDPTLKGVLAGPGGDIGLPPSRASGVASVMILLHYLKGAYYPVGGSGAMRDAFVEDLDRLGVVKKNKAVVQAIRRDGDRWRVEIEGGEAFEAHTVISNVDAADTARLVQGVALPPPFARKAAASRPSLGSLGVYIGTSLDLRAAGMTAANLWHYGSTDIDGMYLPLFEGHLPERSAFFLSAPTLKDPETPGRAPAGRHTLEIVSFVPTAPFRPHFNEPVMRRGPAYQQLKQELTERMLAGAEQHLPGLRDHIEVMEIGRAHV